MEPRDAIPRDRPARRRPCHQRPVPDLHCPVRAEHPSRPGAQKRRAKGGVRIRTLTDGSLAVWSAHWHTGSVRTALTAGAAAWRRILRAVRRRLVLGAL